MPASKQLLLSDEFDLPKVNYERDGNYVTRSLKIGNKFFEERIVASNYHANPQKDFFRSFLEAPFKTENVSTSARPKLTYVDLFCGGGGLSLGTHNAANFLGYTPRLAAAVDMDGAALSLVKEHFKPALVKNCPVEDLVKYEIDAGGVFANFKVDPAVVDPQIAQLKNRVDLLVGGPPCQGHSNLNNKTRRSDPRNLLYFIMPAMAIALDIPMVLIENVRSIKFADEDVVEITKRIFQANGYSVCEAILNASEFGVAQNRVRHFMLARKGPSIELPMFANAFKTEANTFSDVAKDLLPLSGAMREIEKIGELSSENKIRIDFLHDNEIYNLPNHVRPDCHKGGNSYPSVYGRIFEDQPFNTITTGFSSPGRGRYVHPFERRVINVREAGRAQAFPDWYWEKAISLGFKRANFTKIIGDAVPSLFVYPLLTSLML